MQVLSILTMERPVSFEAEDIRDEKASGLRTPSDPPYIISVLGIPSGLGISVDRSYSTDADQQPI